MKIRLKDKIEHTTYFWGDIKEIEGKEVHLIERNKQGNCLCISEKGLVDVDYRDIEN